MASDPKACSGELQISRRHGRTRSVQKGSRSGESGLGCNDRHESGRRFSFGFQGDLKRKETYDCKRN